LASADAVKLIVVAAPPDDVDHVVALLGRLPRLARVSVVAGGVTRSTSVLRALETLPQDVDVVLVHDAARALTPVGLVESVDAAVRAGHAAVIPALPVVDTIKSVAVGPDSALPEVTATVDRASLRAVQTPQGFRRDVLDAAYRAAVEESRLDASDDAGLVEAVGHRVAVVAGDERAFKVTRPLDLLLADALLSEQALAHDHEARR
jgi:2-C-methyl-D-erythritol 4-phosphate cytidylyltransferase